MVLSRKINTKVLLLKVLGVEPTQDLICDCCHLGGFKANMRFIKVQDAREQSILIKYNAD